MAGSRGIEAATIYVERIIIVDSVIALGVGTVFGLVVFFLKHPSPASNAFAGLVAVFGAFSGGELYKMIAPMISS